MAFTDDDTVPDREWLERGLEAMEPANEIPMDAASGRIVMPIPGSPTDYERDAQGLERSEFVTANCFVRRRVLERLGGFDETFRLAWREDSDLHFRLLKIGVVHPVRPAPWGVSVKQQRKVSTTRSSSRSTARSTASASVLARAGTTTSSWHRLSARRSAPSRRSSCGPRSPWAFSGAGFAAPRSIPRILPRCR